MSQKPIQAVSAVIIENDAVLLVKRGNAPMKDKWNLPGGKVEGGESETDALSREVMEETGLTITEESFLGEVRVAEYLINTYKANVLSGEVKAGSDALEAKFVPLGKLTPYELSTYTLNFILNARAKHTIKGHLKTTLTAIIFGLGAYGILYGLMKILKASGFQQF